MTSDDDVAPVSAPQSRAPKIPRKPTRPDFDARDEKLQKLRDKINEYDKVAKAKATEIDGLVNEAKANNKLESLKRTLANTMHSRTQLEVCYVCLNKSSRWCLPVWSEAPDTGL